MFLDLPCEDGVVGFQYDMLENLHIYTDSVQNDKLTLTCCLGGDFGGDIGLEPALKEVLWNNVKKLQHLSILNTNQLLTDPSYDSGLALILLVQ